MNPQTQKQKSPYPRLDKGVALKIGKKTVTKSYKLTPTKISWQEAQKRFARELGAYQYFQKINWPWSPRLIAYSKKNSEITIQRIPLKSIHDYLAQNNPLPLDWLLNKLTQLESDLKKYRINCRGITNKDILVGGKKIWLIDFEATDLKQNYQESLFWQLLFDLKTRWQSHYLANPQKQEYCKRLRRRILSQFSAGKPRDLKRILYSFLHYSLLPKI